MFRQIQAYSGIFKHIQAHLSTFRSLPVEDGNSFALARKFDFCFASMKGENFLYSFPFHGMICSCFGSVKFYLFAFFLRKRDRKQQKCVLCRLQFFFLMNLQFYLYD